MNSTLKIVLTWSDWQDLFKHLLAYSVASIGGPLGLVSELHRYLVTQQHWLTDGQFNASVVLAQAAPGSWMEHWDECGRLPFCTRGGNLVTRGYFIAELQHDVFRNEMDITQSEFEIGSGL